jgi:hypothetical protein
MRKQVVNLLALVAVAIAVSFLVPQRAAADDDDPPDRVARMSYATGNVSFQPAGTDDWVSAVLNRPITTGDKLWSDNGGRAELQLDSAVIRLSSNTGFAFLNLDDNTTQVRLTEGTINIRVRHLEQDETFEVDTPNLAFSILREGNYKIDVNENGDTTIVTVRDGQGEVTGAGSAYTVRPNEIGTFAGVDQLDADIQGYGDQGDDFDRFCSDRDRRGDRSQSSRYVSSDVIGYEDLDDNGGWRPVPEYGNVWFPHTTIVGWAPYRYGHWAWISPWGWTWVDDASWGFAPFHYGRWVTVGGVWGWVPSAPRVVGVAYVRPVYAPALVAWVGGPHFGVGISVGGGVGGGVAWFPLGPREVFVPSYHVSRNYVTRVNVSNTTVNTTVVNNYYNNVVINKNVTNITYVNQRAPNAVTATSHENFTSARPVGRNMIKVDRREVETAQVNVNAPAVAPQQRSVLGSGAAASARPPGRIQDRAVVARRQPPPAPVSFVKQQQAIEANGGRPPAISQTRESQNAGNAVQPRSNIKLAPTATPGTPQNRDGRNRPGEQRYNGNQPGQQQAPQANAPNNANRPSAANTNPSQPAGQPPSNVQNNSNRPPQAAQPVQPVNPPPSTGRDRVNNDRPQGSRPNNANPSPPPNPQRDQRQQQQEQQLRQKQDQERQKVEQKQVQEQQKVDQKNADDRKRQQVEQKQQQQLQQLEQKHQQEQQKLQQKQQQDRQKEKPADKPPKPPKDKKDKDDRPPHNG